MVCFLQLLASMKSMTLIALAFITTQSIACLNETYIQEDPPEDDTNELSEAELERIESVQHLANGQDEEECEDDGPAPFLPQPVDF